MSSWAPGSLIGPYKLLEALGDPLNRIGRCGYVIALLSAGRYAEAAAASRQLIALDPDFAGIYTLLAFDLPGASLPDALAFAERGYARAPWSMGLTGLLAGLLKRSGQLDRSQALMSQIPDPGEYGRPIDLALFHLATGDTGRAIEWIEKAVEQRHPFAMMILIGGPYGRVIRASPRWPDLARKVNLPVSPTDLGVVWSRP